MCLLSSYSLLSQCRFFDRKSIHFLGSLHWLDAIMTAVECYSAIWSVLQFAVLRSRVCDELLMVVTDDRRREKSSHATGVDAWSRGQWILLVTLLCVMCTGVDSFCASARWDCQVAWSLPVHLCFHLSIGSFIHYQTCEHDILKQTNSDANRHKWSTGQGHETSNFGGQEVNSHTMLK